MKVVAVLYPDEHPERRPVVASTARGLDLGDRLEADGRELVTTSDTGHDPEGRTVGMVGLVVAAPTEE